MIKITTGDMMHVHGGFGQKVDYTVRMSVRMKDAVDADLLADALEKTQRRYPYFCVRIKKGEAAYYYEENPLPVVLLSRNGRVSLNTDEVNGHVWAVCYCEDYIHLDFYHGITDGAGMYKVLSTLLYYYCAERYGASKDRNVKTLADPALPEQMVKPVALKKAVFVLPEETEDPQDKLPDVDLSKIPPSSMKPAFTLDTDGGLTPSEATIWDVEIPEEPFMRFVTDNDSTPGTMVSLLLSRAVYNLYYEPQPQLLWHTSAHADEPQPDKPQELRAWQTNASAPEKDIITAYVINARPMLGANNIQHNCLGMAILDFDERIAEMPLTRQCTIYRGKTFAQSFDETIRDSMTVNAARTRAAAEAAPTLDAKNEVFGQAFAGGEGFITILVSYIGKWPYPILGEHICELWTHPPNTFSLMVEISAAGGKIFLTIQQRFHEDCVREAFLRELEEYGIPYKVLRVMESDVARMPEP